MDDMGELERKALIDELIQGRELTKQLQAHFQGSFPLPDVQDQQLLLGILLSYDKALSMLSLQPTTAGGSGGLRPLPTSESPPSPGEGPASGDSDRDNNNNNGDSGNARKAMPTWTKRVRVAPGTAIEGKLEDGYGWRKYGQKDILRAKYPRGYYRCAQRDTQGCPATKQVQRSDEDPAVFEIKYRGRHTCNHVPVSVDPSSSLPGNEEPNDVLVVGTTSQQQQQHQHQQGDLEQQKDRDELLDFYKSLAIITDGSSNNSLATISLPTIFKDSDRFPPPFDTFNFSEAVTGFDLLCENQNFHCPDNSELGLVTSAASGVATSSGTTSQAADTRAKQDYIFDPAEFKDSLGNPEFFPK